MSECNFPPHGWSLRKAEQLARELGCAYDPPKRTGEGRFRHPVAGSSGVYHATSKVATRDFILWLREVRRLSVPSRER